MPGVHGLIAVYNLCAQLTRYGDVYASEFDGPRSRNPSNACQALLALHHKVRRLSCPCIAGRVALVEDGNYYPAVPYSLWTLADRHVNWRTLLEDPAAVPEQEGDKYGLKEAAIVVEADEEDEGEEEESEDAIKARQSSTPVLGTIINLNEEAEINGTDAFVEWAAQFGPNGTGFARTNLVRYPASPSYLNYCYALLATWHMHVTHSTVCWHTRVVVHICPCTLLCS